ncbi:MAG: hypothetical protein A2493_01305 [Candidatus Magasanikbacteria bacterium RIFOXYC12_FULL_33_11]|uniref:Uncharacterized protein n=1 Tax=Candidatus Magasanikbacteria bacterium RIFOXYC12_FULL_33_11 TaxID=1798701 RepID=A0A1F6NLY9_9BACT|nr:MAG: hypothetical protein A2493_01305 [Candidatus Magasanikbacteria bacterium RIFOXYC12_FULL_33_11]
MWLGVCRDGLAVDRQRASVGGVHHETEEPHIMLTNADYVRWKTHIGKFIFDETYYLFVGIFVGVTVLAPFEDITNVFFYLCTAQFGVSLFHRVSSKVRETSRERAPENQETEYYSTKKTFCQVYGG